MDELDFDIDKLGKRMSGAINALKGDFHSLRTGRASSSLLDSINVEVYGSMMPINQCATINVPDPRMITVNVWDKGNVGLIEKAILASGIGINPVIDGSILRLPIPELNEERRKELAKLAGQFGEQARISVRNVRKDGMDKLKKQKSDGMSEDDFKIWSEEIQEITDLSIKQIDTHVSEKQAEIMKI